VSFSRFSTLVLLALLAACTQSGQSEKAKGSQGGTPLGGASGTLDGTRSSGATDSSTSSSTRSDDDDDDDDDDEKSDDDDDEKSDDAASGSSAYYTRISTKVVTDITGTQPNTHKVGGLPCPDGYTKAGTVADCGLGTCNGNQAICIKRERLKSISDDRKVVAKLSLSTLDAHGAPACPSGQELVVSIADCGGGACNGAQVLCKQTIDVIALDSGDKVVLDVAVTGENRHRIGACDEDEGYASFGGVADCGDGHCEGIQAFCARRKQP
jgi:hypothetical protein